VISDPNRTISETHPGTTERPISSADDDKLERGPFVRRVASALVDRKTGKSRGVVVGVTGPWGSGKSSILNLLRERLKEDHPDTIVVSFDPWLISGRNDLISEFINELRATIRSDHRVAEKLGSLIDSITKYGEKLAPAANLLNPWIGTALGGSMAVWKTARSRDKSLSSLREKLRSELTELAVPIVVLIDELDRIEDHEIRTVAQLVRSVADFPAISYVLAYDYDRVVQALGEGASEDKRTERGRAYLEKIVQLQIPLPITFVEEMSRLLLAELTPLQQELRFPENFQDIERYKDLIKLLAARVIETPRDVKRLVGIFHVLGGMLSPEVAWIDLLAYSALMTKAPGTVTKIRSNPEAFCEDFFDAMTFAEAFADQIEERELPLTERLSKLIPPGENNEGVRNLIGFLFPSLSDHPRPVEEYSDALCRRRPLLTTLRLGLLPGSYSKADILSLVTKEPDEIAQSLTAAYDNNTLGPLIDYLDNLYSGLVDIDHVRFWKGVAGFLRKPDCLWMTSFQPMYYVIQNFARILLSAVVQNESFRPVAATVFINLRKADEDVLTAAWLRTHIFVHGLFGNEKRGDEAAFLTSEETETCAREMSITLQEKHLAGELIPCRWELNPVYTMLEMGIWGDPCRKQLNEVLADDRALDGFTLMLYGGTITTEKATVGKMCSYDAYIKRVTERLQLPTIKTADPSVREALRKALNPHLPLPLVDR
jgi:hypothetical protein